jgi:hypothetical protein
VPFRSRPSSSMARPVGRITSSMSRRAASSATSSITGSRSLARLDDAEPEDEATRRSMLSEICRRTDAASDRPDAEVDNSTSCAISRRAAEDPAPSRAAGFRLGRPNSGGGHHADRPRARIRPFDDRGRGRERRARESTTRLRARTGDGRTDSSAGRARRPRRRCVARGGGGGRPGGTASGRRRSAEARSRRSGAADASRDNRHRSEPRGGEACRQRRSARALVATAEAALPDARTAASDEGGRDPLGALHRLEEADNALDRALQGVRDERERKRKARGSLDRVFSAARAEIDAYG